MHIFLGHDHIDVKLHCPGSDGFGDANCYRTDVGNYLYHIEHSTWVLEDT